MTHAEKLQQLFEAALKDPSDVHKLPTRAFPTPAGGSNPDACQPEPAAATAPAPVEEIPVVNFDRVATASAGPGTRPDEQPRQEAGSNRSGVWLFLGLFLALAGCGFCWFVQSPQRVSAWQEAIRDVRSVGDATSIVSKYQAAMAKAGDPSN